MRDNAKILGIVLAALLAPLHLCALGAGTGNADFLKLGVGARPVGLAEAYTASADDSAATYWNPAGLALVSRSEISLMHLAHLADISYESLSLAMPLNRLSGLGISLAYLWQPPFDSTKNTFGAPTQAAGTGSDMALGLSYGYNFGNYRTTDFNVSNISGGLSLRYIRRQLQDLQASALLADAGLVMEPYEGLRWGLALKNFGTTATFSTEADPAVTTASTGLAYTLKLGDANRLLLAADLHHPIDLSNSNYSRWRQSLGLEYQLFGMLALRGGYKWGQDLGGLAAGAGFRFSGLGVDYAFVPYSVLGNTHRVSLSYTFGKEVSRPEVSAPNPPKGLKGIAGDRLVSLAWDASVEKDVIGYNVYYTKTAGKGYVRTNEKPEPKKNSLEVRLKNDETYYFVISAVNAAGKESEFSSEVSLRPHAPTRPGAPTALKSEVQGRRVTLTWKGVEAKDVVGYNVYYTKEPGKSYRKLTKAAPLTDPVCSLKGLTPGQPYYFVITSVTKDGLESDYSTEVFARPQQDTLNEAPAAPPRKSPAAVDNEPI